MKKLLPLLCLLFMGVAVLGQSNAEKASQLTESIDRIVELSEAQKAQVYDFNMTYLSEVAKLSTANLADGSFYRQRSALNEARLRSIQSVLTEEQANALSKLTRN